MSDWTGQDYLNELAGRAGARPPASAGEIWNAEWARSGLDTISGVGRPYADAMRDLEGAIGEAAGQDVTDYAFSQGVNLAGAASQDERAKMLGRLADALPEDKRKTVVPLKDLRRRAAEKAQKIEADANDVAGATYGLSGVATGFVAGIARMTADPFNLAAMIATAPIGGPLQGAAVKVIARQAGAGAAAQAVVEPFIEPARAELGLEHGAAHAFGNIAGAAAGGAGVAGVTLGLGALLRAGARGLRGSRARTADAPLETQAPEPAGAELLSPADLDAVAAVAERDHVMDAARNEPEKIKSAAVQIDGKIYEAANHTFALEQAAAARGMTLEELTTALPSKSDISGFVTNKGRYVDRADAYDIAKSTDQINVEKLGVEGYLGHHQIRELEDATLENISKSVESGAPITESKIVTTNVTARPAGQARYRAHSLLEFIAGNGGISARDPLVADVLQSFGGENPFIPGFGRLIRREGKPLDTQLEAAIEGAYLHDPARQSGGVSKLSQRDVINAIDEEARGNRLYPAGAEGTLTRDEIASLRERDQAARDAARPQIEADFDARLAELQITKPIKGVRGRALQIMEREGQPDPLLAYERALMEYEDKQHAIRQARNAEPDLHIPGWDAVDDAGTAPRLGGDAARADGSAAGGRTGEPARPDSGSDGQPGEQAGDLGGDPYFKAEASRALEAHGGDVEISLPDENGGVRKVSARQAMRELEDEARAASELKNCVGGGAPGATL